MIKTGEVFPDFSYRSYKGLDKSLFSEMGNSPAVILFLRYLGCTKCQFDVYYLLVNKKKILERQMKVFIVFQSSEEVVKEGVDADFPFEIICDPDAELYKRFDVQPAANKDELLKLEEYKDAHARFREERERLGLQHGKYEGEELQKPAIFILNNEKKTVYCHYSDSLMDMPTVEEWLQIYDDTLD